MKDEALRGMGRKSVRVISLQDLSKTTNIHFTKLVSLPLQVTESINAFAASALGQVIYLSIYHSHKMNRIRLLTAKNDAISQHSAEQDTEHAGRVDD